MSYDLLIATRTRPKPDAIAAFAQAKGVDVRTVGMFKPGSNVLVTFGLDDSPTIDVDGPDEVESEDLADDLAGVVPKAKWLVEAHMPADSSPEAHALVLDLAIHLARAGEGAVFDPQEDRIAWPSGVTPRPRGSADERIRGIELGVVHPDICRTGRCGETLD